LLALDEDRLPVKVVKPPPRTDFHKGVFSGQTLRYPKPMMTRTTYVIRRRR